MPFSVPFWALPFDIQVTVPLRLLTKVAFAVWTFISHNEDTICCTGEARRVCALVSPPENNLGITIVHPSLGCYVD